MRILMAMTLLSVNVNKVAVLRNSRGGAEPDVCAAAQVSATALIVETKTNGLSIIG